MIKPLEPTTPIYQYQGTFNHTYPKKPIPMPTYTDFRTDKLPSASVIPERYKSKPLNFVPYGQGV